MNKMETAQVITLLAGNYNNIAEKTKEQKQLMINTWYECLNDLDYNLVLQAVKNTILQSPFPPTIHDVRKNAIEMVKPTNIRTPIEAWEEAYKMICNGTYMTQEEFEKHSPEVKRFFGSTTQLKAYATNVNFNMDVVRSNFLKQYEQITERQKQQKLIPEQMQEIIGQIADKMDIKRLES